MKGAIVFLTVFVVLLAVTLYYIELPPGRMIYNLLDVPETKQLVLGIPATSLVIAVFNGVVYGVIAWLIFTIADRATRRKTTSVMALAYAVQPERKKFCISCGAAIAERAKYCTKCGATQ